MSLSRDRAISEVNTGARLRCGVVGCGAVTERYHLPALLASPDVQVVACVDPVLARARALAGRVGAKLALDRHADLAGQIDFALVAVPNAYHAPIAIELLAADIHVLVEKPMARSAEECDRMIATRAICSPPACSARSAG
jgi:predicted dehydrogenase